jgi:hypothetical protein
MGLLDPPDLYGYTIFCDDIRHEADGKLSFIGAYSNGQMHVHVSFPLTLPKFGFGIFLAQKPKIFEPNIGFRIFLPGDLDDAPSIRGELAEITEGAALARVQEATEAYPAIREAESEKLITMQAHLIFAPVVIKEPGFIIVRAARKNDTVRLGALRILAAQMPSKPPTS